MLSAVDWMSALAAYYSTVLHGMALQSRDGASRKTLTQVVEVAMENWVANCGSAASRG